MQTTRESKKDNGLPRIKARLATKGAKTTEDSTADYIEAVNVRWTPGRDFKNLRQEATFQLVPSRDAQSDAINLLPPCIIGRNARDADGAS